MNTTPATDAGDTAGTAAVDTAIIGAGQAGLALGYYLAQQHRNFVILDAGTRVGDGWRNRWDSLRLFTPAKYNGLPGRPFPGDRLAFTTKDEQADYLEDYASRFHLPVRPSTAVTRLTHDGQLFHITDGAQRWTAANVVLATGACHLPKTPGFAADLPSDVVQLHSHTYRNPAQLKPGPVLLVGAGNSGAEIALETSRTHETWLAGRTTGEIPFRHGRTAARFLIPLVRFAGMHVLNTGTPVGRKVLPKLAGMGRPLIRTKTADLRAAGVQLVPRVAGVRQGEVMLDDGRSLPVANVIWCTGFTEAYPWLDIPALPADWREQQHRGIVDALPGLYLLGQDLLFAAASETLPGVCRDAKYLAKRLAATRPQQDEAQVQGGRVAPLAS
ncbi:flavin-containing monooxygenase [Arthrobacter globiformis]|uniref:flavin-containing monooxygenase n=1 Tax=Arthrobacter globiformis TaxID=1665 RepID=UPI002780AE4E|nr:NAD(P)-binding domain-containing protein [Arthrobacter globiformis]MDQ0863742.1 putative flavoprotein involved in K+ transport [Arthrobacter globiformis]